MDQQLQRTRRIEALKEKTMNATRWVSIEQARIITRVYQENENQSTAMKRALALKAALEEMEIEVDPQELLVGNRTRQIRAGVVFPESGSRWVDQEFETLPVREQDQFQIHPEDVQEFRETIFPYWQGKSLEDQILSRGKDDIQRIEKVVKINQKDHAQGHICPNVQTWLSLGPLGLKKQALEKQKSAPEEKKEFYTCVALVMEGACTFMERYARAIEEMQEAGVRLRKTGEICRKLASHPAKSFQEALQSVWFLFVILHMESNASSFSPGRMDQYLYPYYRQDMDSGRLSRQEALELIEALWIKFNQIVYLRNANSARYFAGFPIGFNIAIDGVDENGQDAANDLSYLFLKAQYDLGLPQPNLSVRLHRHTPSDLIQDAISVVAKGSGMPQFFNDEAIVEPMIHDLKIDPKDAKDYAIVGCVELTTQGNNLGWSDAAMFNMNKALELTLHHGKDLLSQKIIGPDYGGLDTYETVEELETSFARMIDYFIEKMMAVEEIVEKAHQEVLPTAFLSSVIDGCMDAAMDVTAGGAKYNLSGIQMIQAASLADSLAAIAQLVYQEKEVDRKELMRALENNFEGDEVLRARLLYKAPKYGNDLDEVDQIAAKWSLYFRQRLRKYQNYRHGPVHMGMYTVSAHVPMGENVGASADGRKAKEPLADGGLSAVYGRDLSGPTAVLKSVSKIDCSCTTNGGLLNMKFLPSFFQSEEGRHKFETFLRTFVDLKIPHIQFNVVNREDLEDARIHPQQHRSLTVRVAGYTAYFTELAEKLQQEIIERTAYEGM